MPPTGGNRLFLLCVLLFAWGNDIMFLTNFRDTITIRNTIILIP